MAFKPNYNQQRADRNRAKAQKKQEKLKRLEEETAKRKAARGESRIPTKRKRTPKARQTWPRNNKPALTALCFSTSSTRTARRPRTARFRPPMLGGLDGDTPGAHFRRNARSGNRLTCPARPRGRIKSIMRSRAASRAAAQK